MREESFSPHGGQEGEKERQRKERRQDVDTRDKIYPRNYVLINVLPSTKSHL
jgi:hypothetical protein